MSEQEQGGGVADLPGGDEPGEPTVETPEQGDEDDGDPGHEEDVEE